MAKNRGKFCQGVLCDIPNTDFRTFIDGVVTYRPTTHSRMLLLVKFKIKIVVNAAAKVETINIQVMSSKGRASFSNPLISSPTGTVSSWLK